MTISKGPHKTSYTSCKRICYNSIIKIAKHGEPCFLRAFIKRGGEVSRELTEKQIRFVEEYLCCFDGTQAAIKAGYSEKYANRQAYSLLQNPQVQEYLRERRADLQDRTNIKQEDVINELAAVALFDMTDIVNITEIDGRPCIAYTPTAELTEKQRRAIAYIKQGKHGIEIKSHDKMTALKLLGEYLGIFKAKEDIDSLKKMDDILDRIGGNI